MKIEIIKSAENNPVAEFFSSSDTPETDAFKIKFKTLCGEKHWVPAEHSQRLERERDEAREDLEFRRELYALQTERLQRIERERDEAREEVDRYREKLDLSPMHWEV